jgi:hypothetical protein
MKKPSAPWSLSSLRLHERGLPTRRLSRGVEATGFEWLVWLCDHFTVSANEGPGFEDPPPCLRALEIHTVRPNQGGLMRFPHAPASGALCELNGWSFSPTSSYRMTTEAYLALQEDGLSPARMRKFMDHSAGDIRRVPGWGKGRSLGPLRTVRRGLVTCWWTFRQWKWEDWI